MKKLISFLFACTLCLAFTQNSFASEIEESFDKFVFQSGEDKGAVWAYIGFLPRVEDQKRVSIFASKKGLTLRVQLILNRAEIENYAQFLVDRSEQIEEVRKGFIKIKSTDGTYSTPFEVLDKKTYSRYLQEIDETVRGKVNAGFEDNLELLKKYFNENIRSISEEQVVLDIVYPISMQKAPWVNFEWTKALPKAGIYTAHTIENRRTFHSPDASHIFAGFPAFWFDGSIGFHGPIAYTTNSSLLAGLDLLEILRPERKVNKRWQLLRAPVSMGCMRMEHSNELRSMLPANISQALKVKIQILDDYDKIQTENGERIVGVRYYWFDVNKKPDEKVWKEIFYQGKVPTNLKEFPYHLPQLMQIKPLPGSTNSLNPNATADNLMRLPFIM